MRFLFSFGGGGGGWKISAKGREEVWRLSVTYKIRISLIKFCKTLAAPNIIKVVMFNILIDTLRSTKYCTGFGCAHNYQIENLMETVFVKIFGETKQVLSAHRAQNNF